MGALGGSGIPGRGEDSAHTGSERLCSSQILQFSCGDSCAPGKELAGTGQHPCAPYGCRTHPCAQSSLFLESRPASQHAPGSGCEMLICVSYSPQISLGPPSDPTPASTLVHFLALETGPHGRLAAVREHFPSWASQLWNRPWASQLGTRATSGQPGQPPGPRSPALPTGHAAGTPNAFSSSDLGSSFMQHPPPAQDRDSNSDLRFLKRGNPWYWPSNP